jgi:RND family efflux transporter MFP subunit
MKYIAVFLLAIIASAGHFPAHAAPAALVTVATAQRRAVHPHITAYGTVTPDTNAVSNISFPHDVIVTSIFVRTGQPVRVGDPIIAVQTAPNARATYQQAQAAFLFSERDLAHTRELYKEQLATNSQLAAAIRAYNEAKAVLAAQQKIGADTQSQTLHAGTPGVVTSVNISPGDRVMANTIVATIAMHDRLIVDLGLEPSSAGQVQPGDEVLLHSPQSTTESMKGRIVSVAALMDSRSRLVNAAVSVDAVESRKLVLGTVLTGDIILSPRTGVVVPHSGLMTDAEGPYVFVVVKGIAHLRRVRVALDTGQQALLSQGVRPGEQVVVAGNAALEDGMHIRVH